MINHSLFPLSSLSRKRAGEKIRNEAILSQGVESSGEVKPRIVHFSIPCYGEPLSDVRVTEESSR
jgi:hypothetical protein